MTWRDQLLGIVPDEPGWVDTRGVLLENPELFGDSSGCVAVHRGGRLLVAVGAPSGRAFDQALERAHPAAELLATAAAIPYVQRYLGLEGSRAFIHSLGAGGLRRQPQRPEAVLLTPGASLEQFPDEIRWEVGQMEGRWPIAAMFEQGVPVSICFPALVTERYWDVAVETSALFRRCGRAGSAFERLEYEMRQLGREPVWGAAENNHASLALAGKLGFVQIGEVVTFELARRTV